MVLATLAAAAALAAAPGPICGGEGIPYPQAALAATPGALWVACRDEGAVQHVPSGAAATTVALEGFRPWALAAGFGSLWAIDREQCVLLRLDARTGRVVRRITVPGLPVY